MNTTPPVSATAKAVKKWKNKRGALIMALHEIQSSRGYVPWEVAQEVAVEMEVPLARIYEVLTFYNYFKIEAPGKAVISVCTGTACFLKGGEHLLNEFGSLLGIKDGESTSDGLFHLQSVRCVGCCGLAPVVAINGKTYGRIVPADVKGIVDEWRAKFAAE